MKDAFDNELIPGDQVVTVGQHGRYLVKAKVVGSTPTGLVSVEYDGYRIARPASQVYKTGVHYDR